jgi:polygalacturonase
MAVTSGRLQYMLEQSLSGGNTENVVAYGASGNGLADDAPAIQAALNTAKTRGGAWVVIPPGTYRLATLPLRIYANTRLTLLPGAVFVRAADQTLLLNGDASQNFGGYTGHGNLVIEGGRWEMQATTAGLTASRMCISLGHAQNIVVRNVEVRDVPGFHGIEINACKNVIVEGSRFLGYVDPGGRSTSEAIQVDLSAGSGYFGGFGPYDFTACEAITVRDCYVGASGTAGTTAWPRGVGSHSAIVGRWHRRMKVMGCTFDGMLQAGVRTYAWEDVEVIGNSFINCGSAVQARTIDTSRTADTVNVGGTQTNASQDQWGLIVSGNTITNSTGYQEGGIHVLGESTGRNVMVVISNNTIRTVTNGWSGIRMEYLYRAVVSGNVIQDTAGTAISQANVEGATITGNKIHNPGVSGISANTCVDVEVIGNNITVCGLNGVHVVTGTNTKISDNFIKACGRTDGTGYGIRVTTSSAKTTITGNTYLKFGSAPEAVNALSITAGNTGVRRWGNDWIGQGVSADVSDLSTSPNLSPYDAGTP